MVNNKKPIIYNIYDPEAVTEIAWRGPYHARQAKHIPELLNESHKSLNEKEEKIDLMKHIRPDDYVITIGPGESLLCHTLEWIGTSSPFASMMKTRSSIGKNFLQVCKCSGWGNIGFKNRWTMEITNISSFLTIPLVVGRRIAQIVFLQTNGLHNPKESSYGNHVGHQKYQNGDDITKIFKLWSPKDMLPKLDLDLDLHKHYSDIIQTEVVPQPIIHMTYKNDVVPMNQEQQQQQQQSSSISSFYSNDTSIQQSQPDDTHIPQIAPASLPKALQPMDTQKYKKDPISIRPYNSTSFY
jgi:deoxycytidine triphosphate deaminase